MIYKDLFGKILKDQYQNNGDIIYFSERDDNLIEHRSAKSYFTTTNEWSQDEIPFSGQWLPHP